VWVMCPCAAAVRCHPECGLDTSRCLSASSLLRCRQEHPSAGRSAAAIPAAQHPRPHGAERRISSSWTRQRKKQQHECPSSIRRAHKQRRQASPLPSTERATVRPGSPKRPHQQHDQVYCTPHVKIMFGCCFSVTLSSPGAADSERRRSRRVVPAYVRDRLRGAACAGGFDGEGCSVFLGGR